MRTRRLLSRVLIANGAILLAFWAFARVDSHVAMRTAVINVPDMPARADAPIAILCIPRLKLETPVFRGTDALTLNRGAGWITETAAPGTNGNTAIAAHRDSVFRPLKDIAVNDAIELRTRSGTRTFVVRQIRIVRPTNVSVLAPSREPTLTLITCYPFYFVGAAPKRFIVRAVATAAP